MTRILIDENLPAKLKFRFGDDFEILTVHDMGWASKKNGELLKLIEAEKFDFLLTVDRNIEYQQNMDKITFGLIILITNDNRYQTVLPFVEKIKLELIINKSKLIRL
jgi:hypothetical protein